MRVREPVGQDHVLGTGGPYRVDQILHTGDLVGEYCVSGIGFRQPACTSEQSAELPPYRPQDQCGSTVDVMPCAFTIATGP
ncbi:hypothetical protein GCM10023084_38350 [Streptomyces lacrimifluminis]|uniref:Uncharacterized protein n=1 Tax=Streptomyces lacrimifluminis TaxID=1500077 RepID=A0A917L3T9_9ACTN|nr:hypothetical protein GCM10012282_39970 [Streptomyces lacrimifluminis]